MYIPILNIEGSQTALVPSSTFLNISPCKPKSRNVKYLDSIPDPETNFNPESITTDPDPKIDPV